MRKIIESTLVSADGVVGSPPLWAMDYRDEEVTRDALERLSGSDAMLMGRGTYELFAATWPGQTDDFAQRVNTIRKYVFSSTLTGADWNNSTIVRGDVVAQVTRIKATSQLRLRAKAPGVRGCGCGERRSRRSRPARQGRGSPHDGSPLGRRPR
jgi:dihydrofolate reductase